MITPSYLRLMAQYNRAMNERTYAICAQLTDEARKADRGAFFGSIHRTLNHIVWADARAVARMSSMPMPADDTRLEMYADFEKLWAERRRLDDTIVALAERLPQALLDAPTTVQSVATGRSRTWPMGAFLVHLFNHQTHHRAQVGTLLSQIGHDIGVTDLPWLEIEYTL